MTVDVERTLTKERAIRGKRERDRAARRRVKGDEGGNEGGDEAQDNGSGDQAAEEQAFDVLVERQVKHIVGVNNHAYALANATRLISLKPRTLSSPPPSRSARKQPFAHCPVPRTRDIQTHRRHAHYLWLVKLKGDVPPSRTELRPETGRQSVRDRMSACHPKTQSSVCDISRYRRVPNLRMCGILQRMRYFTAYAVFVVSRAEIAGAGTRWAVFPILPWSRSENSYRSRFD